MLCTCCARVVLLVLVVHVSLREGLTVSGAIRNPMGGGLAGVSLIRASYGGGNVVQWASVSGRLYAVQCGGQPGAWSNATGTATHRFYRLKAQRAP